MTFFGKISGWLQARKRKPLDQLLSVSFDEVVVSVVVLAELEPNWNQSFNWVDVKRVCFMDEGLYASDLILIHLIGRDKPVVVPTEAAGGAEFLGALTARGCFPEQALIEALGDTSGGLHCWPPMDSSK